MHSQVDGRSENLRDRLDQALRRALKARDAAAVAALRSALAAIGNAEAVDGGGRLAPGTGSDRVAGSVSGVGAAEVARRDLPDAELAGIVEREVADRVAAADEYDRVGRPDRAERLRHEAGALAAIVTSPSAKPEPGGGVAI